MNIPEMYDYLVRSRRDLWAALERYAGRDRRFGGAVDRPQEQSEQRP